MQIGTSANKKRTGKKRSADAVAPDCESSLPEALIPERAGDQTDSHRQTVAQQDFNARGGGERGIFSGDSTEPCPYRVKAAGHAKAQNDQ